MYIIEVTFKFILYPDLWIPGECCGDASWERDSTLSDILRGWNTDAAIWSPDCRGNVSWRTSSQQVADMGFALSWLVDNVSWCKLPYKHFTSYW